MKISLPPELEELINEKVKSGLYNSPSEVVREGLRLLREQDELKRLRREELRCEVMKGINAVKEGRYSVYNSADDFADKIISEITTKAENERK